MTVEPATLIAILLMASATYLTRIGGYLLLGDRRLSPRTRTVMDAAPGCVLVSVIAPAFGSGRPADLIALGLTALAATRLSILPTVLVGVATAGLLRFLLQG